MDLFRIHTVPVPLDIDTYQGKESKCTTLDSQYKYLATNGHEYMDVTDAALESCNLHLIFIILYLHKALMHVPTLFYVYAYVYYHIVRSQINCEVNFITCI